MGMLLSLLLVGALANIVVGVIGTGSSMLILPFLVYYFPAMGLNSDTAIHMAVGTCIASISVGAFFSAIGQARQKNVDWHMVWIMSAGYIIGAIIGPTIAHFLSAHILKAYLGVFITISGLLMLWSSRQEPVEKATPASLLIIASLIVGILSSVAGVASGILMVPFLSSRGLPIKTIIGTSTVTAVPYCVIGAIGYIVSGQWASNLPHWSLGYVYLPAFLLFALTALLFVPVGIKLGQYCSAKWLRKGFAIFLILAGLNLVAGAFFHLA